MLLLSRDEALDNTPSEASGIGTRTAQGRGVSRPRTASSKPEGTCHEEILLFQGIALTYGSREILLVAVLQMQRTVLCWRCPMQRSRAAVQPRRPGNTSPAASALFATLLSVYCGWFRCVAGAVVWPSELSRQNAQLTEPNLWSTNVAGAARCCCC